MKVDDHRMFKNASVYRIQWFNKMPGMRDNHTSDNNVMSPNAV